MLPFLEPKKITSVIIAKKGKPDLEASPEQEAPDSKLDPGLKSAGEDILRASETKSVIDLVKGLLSFIQIVDSMPHVEGPHEEEEEENEY